MKVLDKILASEADLVEMEKKEEREKEIRSLLLQQNKIKHLPKVDIESFKEVFSNAFLRERVMIGRAILDPYVAIFSGDRYKGFYRMSRNKLIWSTKQ